MFTAYNIEHREGISWIQQDWAHLLDDSLWLIASQYEPTVQLLLKAHQFPKCKCFSFRLAVDFALIHWSQVWSQQWRFIWHSAVRWCSHYIWVISNFIYCRGVACIWDLTVVTIECNICVPPQYSLDVTGDIEGFKISNSSIALVGTCESYFIGVDDLWIIISNIMFTLLKRDS